MFSELNIDWKDILDDTVGLSKIDGLFLDYVKKTDIEIFNIIIEFRQNKLHIEDSATYHSLILKLPLLIEEFLIRVFQVTECGGEYKTKLSNLDLIYKAKKLFIQRYVLQQYNKESFKEINFKIVSKKLEEILGPFSELKFAQLALFYMQDPNKYAEEIKIFTQYGAYQIFTNSDLFIFNVVRKKNANDVNIREHKIAQYSKNAKFKFSYRGPDNYVSLGFLESKYCIYCHNKNKDSCRKGLSVLGNKYKDKAFFGCPLKQKISEMNLHISAGNYIAALAVIMLDNPLLALTGKRICNDCELSCIYQTQDPVDVPLIETSILENILSMRYGAEIYFLLAKWNPLNFLLPFPRPNTNRNILVAGIGPSGIGISHYLMNLGHNVFAIDAFAIRDLDCKYHEPIKYWKDFIGNFSEDHTYGFGGVTDYGITHRWNKNNLHLVRVLLHRRSNFRLFGNVRLGSSLSIKDAFRFGFDHIALCIGAGRPRASKLFNYSAHNIYTSNEFLMTINQSKPYLRKNIDRLFIIRLPIVILGCGLSAIDSAVEAMQYYISQLENFKTNYLKFLSDNPNIEVSFTKYQKDAIQEFLLYEDILSKLNTKGKIDFLKQKKAVTILSKSKIVDSAAYKENFAEIEHAMALGIHFEEGVQIQNLEFDEHKIVKKIHLASKIIDVNFLITAIGNLKNDFFDNESSINHISKFFLDDDLGISYLGDCNKFYSGSVVKALASAKDIFWYIDDVVMQKNPKIAYKTLEHKMNEQFNSYVTSIQKISANVLNITVKSSRIAEKFQPGQFCRFSSALYNADNLFQPKFFTIFDNDPQIGEVCFMVSVDKLKYKMIKDNLHVNSKLDILGPNGSSLKIHDMNQYQSKIVIFIANNFRAASLYQIIKFFKQKKFKVIFFWSVTTLEDLFFIEQFQNNTDYFFPNVEDHLYRADEYFQGNLVDSVNQVISTNIEIYNYFDKVDQIFVSLDYIHLNQLLSINYINEAKIKYFHNNRNFFCSSKGICGSCIIQSTNSECHFACRNHIYSLGDFGPPDLEIVEQDQKMIKKILTQT